MKRALIAGLGMTLGVALGAAGCKTTPVATGSANTTVTARKQLEGQWTMVALTVISPDGKRVTPQAAGDLSVDEFSNLKIEYRLSDSGRSALEGVGMRSPNPVISGSGRVAIDPQRHTVTYMPPDANARALDADGKVIEGATSGNLCIADSWPGQMRTVFGDHQRFIDTYFKTYPGKYFTGDGCRRDADGYYWITGRVDDVINVAGHRLGTAEVESALVAHAKVSEAAVVGYPHDIKGQGIYAYVTLMTGEQPSEDLRKELVAWVRKEIGPIASPDLIQFAPGLPKTRSGKIMRRILRKIAEDDYGALGDTSTLADPAVVDDLVKNRQNKRAGA